MPRVLLTHMPDTLKQLREVVATTRAVVKLVQTENSAHDRFGQIALLLQVYFQFARHAVDAETCRALGGKVALQHASKMDFPVLSQLKTALESVQEPDVEGHEPVLLGNEGFEVVGLLRILAF